MEEAFFFRRRRQLARVARVCMRVEDQTTEAIGALIRMTDCGRTSMMLAAADEELSTFAWRVLARE